MNPPSVNCKCEHTRCYLSLHHMGENERHSVAGSELLVVSAAFCWIH